ncbi:hypothetical protein MY11210_009701 [Beauveria gryllotalpidicola]
MVIRTPAQLAIAASFILAFSLSVLCSVSDQVLAEKVTVLGIQDIIRHSGADLCLAKLVTGYQLPPNVFGLTREGNTRHVSTAHIPLTPRLICKMAADFNIDDQGLCRESGPRNSQVWLCEDWWVPGKYDIMPVAPDTPPDGTVFRPVTTPGVTGACNKESPFTQMSKEQIGCKRTTLYEILHDPAMQDTYVSCTGACRHGPLSSATFPLTNDGVIALLNTVE